MNKVYSKFGKTLKDPATELEIKIPKSMKVLHHYNINLPNSTTPKSLLSGTLHKQLTVTTGLDKGCCICGSRTNLEMHHIRQVADVRAKIMSGKSTYEQ